MMPFTSKELNFFSSENQKGNLCQKSVSAGHCFDHDTPGILEEQNFLPPETHGTTPVQSSFQSIPTVWVSFCKLVLLILTEVFIFYLPWHCSSHKCGFSAYSWIILWEGITWIIFLLLQAYISHHLDKVRLRGYLEYYRNYSNYKWLPFLVLSGGCVLTMMVIVLIEESCTSPTCDVLSIEIEPVIYIQIIITLQALALVPFLIFQMKKTYRFNSKRHPPDAQRDELASRAGHHSQIKDLGFRLDDNIEDVIERQDDIIRYLRQHNHVLSNKIVELSEQVDHLQRKVREQRLVIMNT